MYTIVFGLCEKERSQWLCTQYIPTSLSVIWHQGIHPHLTCNSLLTRQYLSWEITKCSKTTTPLSHSIYIRTVTSQCLLLSALWIQFRLVYGSFVHIDMHSTAHLISAPDQTSQKENNCPTIQKKLRAYCPDVYTVSLPFFVYTF